MAFGNEFLWRIYEDHQEMVRHYDRQRAVISQFLLILATGAAGVAKLGEFSLPVNVVLALFVVMIGAVGIYLAYRTTRACASQRTCGLKYLDVLERRIPSLKVGEPEAEHRDSGAVPWHILNGLVVLLGIALLICIYLHA